MSNKTCFVSMGFGKKTDFVTGRTLDLDKTYKTIIRPAVTGEGLDCIRADEVIHSGIIDLPMFEQLLAADLMISDLSTLNPNALYELGVRHALRPSSTIVIAEQHTKLPFDIGFVDIHRYEHLGEGIDFGEVERFRNELSTLIRALANQPQPDSPVYVFLQGLIPPTRMSAARVPAPSPPSAPVPDVAADWPGATVATLMEESEAAITSQNWDRAKELLELIRSMKGSTDPYVLQRLALATYRSRKPTQRQALEDAREILATLAPGTLNDPEVLSIWGAIHARRWELLEERSALDTAVLAYEKAFHFRGDYQDGVTLAFLLNARAAISGELEAAADFVAAQRVRREVVAACVRILEESRNRSRAFDEYAVRAALAEAWFGLGDEIRYASELQRADAVAPHPSLRESTQDRIARLALLLEFSPLKYLGSL